MNEIYAANPSAIQSSKDLRYFISKFGPYTGRYLLKYPNHWDEILMREIAGDLEVERIKTIMRRASQNLQIIGKKNTPWSHDTDWDQNATQYRKMSNDKVFCISCPGSAGEDFIMFDDFDPPPTTEERVNGNEKEYTRIAKLLLMLSPELHFIDPYINLRRSAYTDVLQSMLKAAARGKCKRFVFWCRLSTIANGELGLNDRTFIEGKILEMSSRAEITPGSRLEMHLLRDDATTEKIHARYLLSIKGGIRFDQGFQRLPQGRRADVAPIGEQLHAELLDQFKDLLSSSIVKESITVVSR